MINKEELIELLIARYGEINNFGCYTDNGEWLSIQKIVDCINECEEYQPFY